MNRTSSAGDIQYRYARRQRQLAGIVLHLQTHNPNYEKLVEKLKAADQVAWDLLAAHVGVPALDTAAQADVIEYFTRRLAQPAPADAFAGL